MEYNIKADLEKAAKHAEDARALVDVAKSEARELSSDENKQFDTLMEAHQKAENSANQKKRLNEAFSSKIESIEKKAEETGKSVNKIEDEKEMSKRCLKSYLLKGFNGMTNDEKEFVTRSQSTIVNSEGGYTVDTMMSDAIIQSMLQTGGMREVASVITTAQGGQMNFPTNNDTANVGRWLAEKSAATNTDTVFGTAALNAWTASSDYIPVSAQLIQDSAYDIEAYIVSILGMRLGRLSNAGYTTGDSSSKPTGVATTSLVGKAAAAIAATTFNEMLDLKHSVDRAYRANGTWMFNDNTLLALKKLSLSSANQSLWQPGVVAGEPSTIDGQRYTVNNDLPDMAAGTHPIIYGDFSKYQIRDTQGINIRRSEHVAFLNNEITFLGELRTDGKLLDTAAVKHMRMSNS
jgi:HK97 family phage major capsid protein